MNRRTLLLGALLLSAACAGRRSEPPTPDEPQRPPPDLSGERVMVLPAQPAAGASPIGVPVPGLDEEIAFWLAESAPRVDWVFPPDIQRALDRSPSLDIRIDALAVSSFHRAQVQRIGDPLFGDLRALNVLVNARYALVPVAAGYVQGTTGEGRVEMHLALIDTQGGAVLWFGAVAGDPGPMGSREVTATAGRELARTLTR